MEKHNLPTTSSLERGVLIDLAPYKSSVNLSPAQLNEPTLQPESFILGSVRNHSAGQLLEMADQLQHGPLCGNRQCLAM